MNPRRRRPPPLALALLALALSGAGGLLAAAPALAQHGTVASLDGRQITVRLSEGYTVLAAAIGDVVVPETQLTSAQVMVNAVRDDVAECTVLRASRTHPPRVGFPVRFDRPVQQGTLTVTSEPAGAAVAVDGDRSGRTPASELLLPEGTYTIGLTYAGYAPDSARVTVSAGEETTHHVALRPIEDAPADGPALEPDEVQLILTSTPGGANVFVNGVPRAYTPDPGRPPRAITLPAEPRLAIELRLEKHLTVFDTLTVAPGQVWEEHYVLEEKRAPLSVLVYPWGSDVFVDDALVGRTPYAGEYPWGYHAVRVERPGFAPFVRDSAFVWGMTSQRGAAMAEVVEGTLERALGWLRVRSGPAGAEVRLDGVAVGRTPLVLRVPPGRYTVSIESGGAQVHQERVTVGIRDDLEVVYGTPPP